MQVGITQIILPKLSMSEFLTQAAAAGYEVVEICLRREGDLTLNTSDSELAAIAAQARSAGVTIVSMTHSHCTGNLLDCGQPQRTSIDETCRGLEIAAKLGVGCTLHTLGRLKPEVYYDDAFANAIASLKEIARTCERVGVDLAVEQIWNGFAFSPLEMRRLLDEVNSPRVGFYFDPGNMAVFHYPHHWVKVLGSHVKMVHLKDWKGKALNGSWPALLEGDVDYAAMNRELRAIGYDGPMISEVSPNAAPLDATAHSIRKIITL